MFGVGLPCLLCKFGYVRLWKSLALYFTKSFSAPDVGNQSYAYVYAWLRFALRQVTVTRGGKQRFSIYIFPCRIKTACLRLGSIPRKGTILYPFGYDLRINCVNYTLSGTNMGRKPHKTPQNSPKSAICRKKRRTKVVLP